MMVLVVLVGAVLLGWQMWESAGSIDPVIAEAA